MSRRKLLRGATAITAVLAMTAAGFAVNDLRRGSDGTLAAIFADASPLVSGSELRASGVKVGNVDTIELEGGKARVTFSVDDGVLPVHRDARMLIRPVNLLGENYVELDAGTPSKPHLESDTIPLAQTSSQVTLQDVIDTFHDPTAAAMAMIVTEMGEGVAGSGRNTAAMIKGVAPVMQDAERLAKLIDSQNSTLLQLLDRVHPVAQALAADNGKALDRVVVSTERMLSSVAANKQALDETVKALPAVLASARRTLTKLAGAAGKATPTLAAVRPMTGDLKEISGELLRFADAADPALASLRPVLRRAQALLDRAGPVVDLLRQAGPDLRGTAKNARRLGDQLLDRSLGDLMAFVRKWSLSTNGRDGLSHYFRGVFHVTPNTLKDLAGAVTGGPLPDTPMPKLPKVPVPKTPSLDLPDPDSVTGLSEQQEHSMLSQLLGGV